MPDQTLAQRIKKKYPGQYDDLPDADLEAKIKAKYPGQYDDLPTTTAAAEAPAAKPRIQLGSSMFGSTGPSYDPLNPYENARTAAAGAPAVAAVMTGGLSLPAQMGIQGGVGVASRAIQGQGVKDSLIGGVEDAAVPALLAGAGQVAKFGAKYVEQKAVNLWLRAAKISDSLAKDTQAAKAAGSVAAGKEDIAKTVLNEGLGWIRKGNANAMKAGLDALDDELKAAIASSTATIPRASIAQALTAESTRIGEGTLAKAAQQKALAEAGAELLKLPADISVQEAQAIKQSIYKARNYAMGAADSAASAADKTMGRAYRAEIASAVPEVRPINDALSRGIPATKAMNEAVAKGQNRPMFNLGQTVAAATHNLPAAAMSTLNVPSVGSFTAQRLYDVAQSLGVDHPVALALINALFKAGNPPKGK